MKRDTRELIRKAASVCEAGRGGKLYSCNAIKNSAGWGPAGRKIADRWCNYLHDTVEEVSGDWANASTPLANYDYDGEAGIIRGNVVRAKLLRAYADGKPKRFRSILKEYVKWAV